MISRLTFQSLQRLHLTELLLASMCGIGIGVIFLASPILGVIAALSVLFTVIGLIQPAWICSGLVIATVLTSGMTRGRLLPYLIPNEIFLVLGSGLALPFILTQRMTRQPALLLWIGLIGLGAGNSILPFLIYQARQVPLTTSEIMALFAPLQYLLIFWIFRNLPRNQTEIRQILKLMLVSSAIVAIIGLLQAARIDPVSRLLHTWYPSTHEETAVEVGRISSILGAWNSLGTFMGINLLIIRSVLGAEPSILKPWILILIVIADASCLLASGSYAGLIGFFLGIGIIELLDQRSKTSLLVLFIGMLLMAIPLRESIAERLEYQFQGGSWIPQTLAFRFKVWEEVFWPVLGKNWLLGFHPIVPKTFSWLYPESQYLSLLLRGGILALLAHFLWIGTSIAWLSHQIQGHTGLLQGLSKGLLTIFVVLSIMGITNSVFTFSCVIEYIFISLGLLASSTRNSLQFEKKSSVPSPPLSLSQPGSERRNFRKNLGG